MPHPKHLKSKNPLSSGQAGGGGRGKAGLLALPQPQRREGRRQPHLLGPPPPPHATCSPLRAQARQRRRGAPRGRAQPLPTAGLETILPRERPLI